MYLLLANYLAFFLLTNSLAMSSVLPTSRTGLCTSLSTSTARHCGFTFPVSADCTTRNLAHVNHCLNTLIGSSPSSCLYYCVCQFWWVCDGWKSSNKRLSTGALFLFFLPRVFSHFTLVVALHTPSTLKRLLCRLRSAKKMTYPIPFLQETLQLSVKSTALIFLLKIPPKKKNVDPIQ